MSRTLEPPGVAGFDASANLGERSRGLLDEEVHELPEELAVSVHAPRISSGSR